MNKEKIFQLEQGLTTAFINQNLSSNLAYKPQFISNNHKQGKKVFKDFINQGFLEYERGDALCKILMI